VRKSLKSLRDPEAFARCKRALEALQKHEANGKIDLYYFDEAGFALDPTIPSAWQEAGEVIELPTMKYGRINVLGFMNRNNDVHAYMFDQSIHTGVVIGCFDVGRPNRFLAIDRFLDSRGQSRLSSAWWRSIFHDDRFIQARQLRPIAFFIPI
jgi:hypothetical protein